MHHGIYEISPFATILGFQRLVNFTLNIPGQIKNNIPKSIRVLPGHRLKASLHRLLLHILELEDTYVDTPTLIKKLSKMTRNVK